MSLTLESLLHMQPYLHGTNYIQTAAKHLFLVHLKKQPSVKDVFFHSNSKLNRENISNYINEMKCLEVFEDFDFDRFSVLLVCQTISKIRNRLNFNELLDGEKIEELLNCVYCNSRWSNISFQLYCLCTMELMVDLETGVKLKQYVQDDGVKWAQRIAAHYKSGLNVLIDFPFMDQSPQALQDNVNILLTKVHLLDPSKTQQVFDLLKRLLPGIKMTYRNINYLGDTFDWKEIKDEVQNAIIKPSLPSNVSKMSLSTLEVFHGIGVCEFILNEARELGVWTGKYPDNQIDSRLIDRCCVS